MDTLLNKIFLPEEISDQNVEISDKNAEISDQNVQI
jgi:hypothetical protein